MAKKQTKDSELTKAEKEKLRRPIGVYVRKDDRIDLEEITEKEEIKLHALLGYAIRYFLRQYKAGKVKIEKEQITRLK